MIVYNVTTKVRWNIMESWLAWQLEEQIPAILATGTFDDYKLFRLLDEDEEEGPTFIVQFHTTTTQRYHRFTAEYSATLQQIGRDKWGDRFIAFRTVMESL